MVLTVSANSDSLTIYYTKGKLSKDQANNDSAIFYFKHALKFCDDSFQYASIYSSIGTGYLKLSDYYTAIKYYDSAMATIPPGNISLQAAVEINLGLCYSNLQKSEKAIFYFDLARDGVYPRQEGALYHNIAKNYQYLGKNDSALANYQEAYRYKLSIFDENPDTISLLMSVFEIVELTGNKKLLSNVQHLVTDDKYIRGWNHYLNGRYTEALSDFGNNNFWRLRVLSTMEDWDRAVTEIDSLRKSYLDIDSKLFLQENERSIYNNAIEHALLSDTTRAFKLALKSRANLLRDDLGDLPDVFPRSYNYFDFDSVIYLFRIDHSIHFHRIHVDNEFMQQYRTFTRCLQLDSIKEDYYQGYLDYCRSAQYLFNKLIPCPDSDMYIVPDGRIHYIPFEALLSDDPDTTEPDYKTLPYLMNTAQIRYDYMLRNYGPAEKKKATITMLAPDMRLIYSQKLAKFVRKFRGKVYRGERATVDKIYRGNLLHIDAHYYPEDKYIDVAHSRIDVLNIDSLPKELTIIATCYSGIGDEFKGEGVFSPGRSFYKAGSKAVIESIWQSDDESSYEILRSFYNELKAGNPSCANLNFSKKLYLQNCLHSKSHPYYWAHMRSFGSACMPVVAMKVNNVLILLIIGAIAVIVVIQYLPRLLRK